MNKLLLSAALAASFGAGSAANAQAIPGAIVAVVDVERVTGECTACKTARASLQGQVAALQAQQKTLAGPLEAEQKSIQAAADALQGKQPDAALQARAKAFQTKYQQAQEQIARQEEQIKRNQAFISQQVMAKLEPIYQQVMQKRGANLLVDVNATLATSTSVDVTNDVLAALNTSLPTVQTTAPTQPKQPQGR
jgi:Skp family chaperone for outer membrane proteins